MNTKKSIISTVLGATMVLSSIPIVDMPAFDIKNKDSDNNIRDVCESELYIE